jgi:predicted small lipoprotein YifL
MKRFLTIVTLLALVVSLAACGGEEAPAPVTMPAQDVYAQLEQQKIENAMLKLNEGLLLDLCGIRSEDVKQAVVAICEDSLLTDEVWVVEATDEAAAQRIIELAKNRLKKKGEESITYSPEQYAVVEKAQLLQNGSFVVLLVAPNVTDMAASLETVTGTTFQKVN